MFTAVVLFGLLAYFRFIRPLHVFVAAIGLSLASSLALDPRAAVRFAKLGRSQDPALPIKLPVTVKPLGDRRGSGLFGRQALRLKRGRLACFPRSIQFWVSVRGTSAVLFDALRQSRGPHRNREEVTAGHNLYLENVAETGDFGARLFPGNHPGHHAWFMENQKKVAVRGFEFSRCRNGFFSVSGCLLISGNFRALVLSKVSLALDGPVQRHDSHSLAEFEQQTRVNWVPRDWKEPPQEE